MNSEEKMLTKTPTTVNPQATKISSHEGLNPRDEAMGPDTCGRGARAHTSRGKGVNVTDAEKAHGGSHQSTALGQEHSTRS